MSVIAYVGLPGHGKSYQVVSVVILDGLKQGRRVITNVAVIPEAIDEFLIKEGTPAEEIGEIIQVTHAEIAKPSFFPTKKQVESKEEHHENTIVQPGDLVILDEAWEHFGVDANINQATFEYLRYHRHDTHPKTGIAADIVLLSQDIYDIHPSMRRIIEMTVMTTKAKELGMDGGYRIDIYHKTFLRRKPTSSRIGYYNKKYFGLYKSYDAKNNSGAKASEKRVDKRQSILNTPFFKYGMPLAFVAFVSAVIYGWITYKEWGRKLDEKGLEKKAAIEKVEHKAPTAAENSGSSQNLIEEIKAGNNAQPQGNLNRLGNANGKPPQANAPPPPKKHPFKDYKLSYTGISNLNKERKDEHYFAVSDGNKGTFLTVTLSDLKSIGYTVKILRRCTVILKYEEQETDLITCDNFPKDTTRTSITNAIPQGFK